MSVPERRAMVERPGETLSVRRQCALLNLSRSGVYRPGPVTSADDLAADSARCRPPFRNDLAHRSDLMSPAIPR